MRRFFTCLFFVLFCALPASAEWKDVSGATVRATPLVYAPKSSGFDTTIPSAAQIAIGICFDAGDWCEATYKGERGFVSGKDVTVNGSKKLLKDAYSEYFDGLKMADAQRAYNKKTALVSNNVVVWGDSLTAGTGSSKASETSFPSVASLKLGVTVENKGVPGQTSTQVKDRFDADPTLWARTTWIWVGRNNVQNPEAIESDIAGMVKSLGHGRYLIGSILPKDDEDEYKGHRGYDRIIAINNYLSKTYGDHYVDVWGALMAKSNPEKDAADIEHGITPTSLRNDTLHLKDSGYEIVAEAFIKANASLK